MIYKNLIKHLKRIATLYSRYVQYDEEGNEELISDDEDDAESVLQQREKKPLLGRKNRSLQFAEDITKEVNRLVEKDQISEE